jgi:hypothetical protein
LRKDSVFATALGTRARAIKLLTAAVPTPLPATVSTQLPATVSVAAKAEPLRKDSVFATALGTRARAIREKHPNTKEGQA